MHRALLLLPLALLLTACPAANDSEPPLPPAPPEPETITQLGLVQLVETTGADFQATSAVASFNEVPDVRAPDNPFASSLDTCFVTQDPDANPPFLGFPGGVVPGRDLDAGETITVFAGEETFTTLRREDRDGPFYLQDDQSLGALPEVPLSVSVPGAAFPAFERASFVKRATPYAKCARSVRTRHAGEHLYLDTFYASRRLQRRPLERRAARPGTSGERGFPHVLRERRRHLCVARGHESGA